MNADTEFTVVFFYPPHRIVAHLAPCRRYQTKDSLFFTAPVFGAALISFSFGWQHNSSRQNVFENRAPHLTCAYAHIFAYCCRSVIDCIDIP